MSNIRDIRESTIATLKKSGMSSQKAEEAGKRLERHLERKERGLPVSDRPSILHDKRR